MVRGIDFSGLHMPFQTLCLQAAGKSRDTMLYRQRQAEHVMWLSAAQDLLRRGSGDNRRCGQGDYGPGAGRRGQGGRPGKTGQRVLRVRLDLVVRQRAQVCPLKALLQCTAHTVSAISATCLPPYLAQLCHLPLTCTNDQAIEKQSKQAWKKKKKKNRQYQCNSQGWHTAPAWQ